MKREEKELTEDLRASAVGRVVGGRCSLEIWETRRRLCAEPKTEVDCGAGAGSTTYGCRSVLCNLRI